MQPANRVLVVEDDPEVRLALQQVLKRDGFDVQLAHNGAEAIELLDTSAPPRVVLVDLLMPGVVGHELLEYMRGEPALADIPVAIISGSPQLAPAGYKVFSKPLDAKALIEFVRAPVRPDPRPAT